MNNAERQATFRAKQEADGKKLLRAYVPAERLEVIKQIVQFYSTTSPEVLAAWRKGRD